jgi:hypothetical protein
MRKRNLFLLVAICVALVPAGAWAGGTGACFVVTSTETWPAGDAATPDGQPFNLAGCANGFTQEECTAVDSLVEFWEGATCDDVAGKGGFKWDGSCDASVDPIGSVCLELWTAQGGLATEALCVNEIGGDYSAGAACGAPVPTMPPLGLAALMLLMLAGALFFMAKRSPQTTV